MSHWVKTSPNSRTIAADGALAIQAARQTPGQIATLILPADTAWGAADGIAETAPPAAPAKVSDAAVKAAAAMLRSGERATLLMGGDALRQPCLELAGRIAAKTGCGILTEGANTRLERGAGRVQVERIPYVVERALGVMRAAGNLVLVGAREPVAFFAYPDKPSLLMPKDAKSTKLAGLEDDMQAALEALAIELGAMSTAPAGVAAPRRPALPTGDITPAAIASILGAMLPENAIVVDESVTTGREFFPETAGAPPHDWINNRGGSIGYGMPVAVGAAIACPDRKVIALVGDGSAMYTLQALWTMAQGRPGRHGADLRQRHLQYPARRADQRRRAQPRPACRRHAVDRTPGPRLGVHGARHGRGRLPRQDLRSAGQGLERRPALRRPLPGGSGRVEAGSGVPCDNSLGRDLRGQFRGAGGSGTQAARQGSFRLSRDERRRHQAGRRSATQPR